MEKKDIKVLLVDDMEFIKFVEKNILTEEGYTVVGEASNGKEAIEKYKELKPDVVILDISMPEMDGIEALKKIKEIDKDAKIIVCSAMGQPQYIKTAISLGAIDFIVKPFKKERLISAIQKAFS